MFSSQAFFSLVYVTQPIYPHGREGTAGPLRLSARLEQPQQLRTVIGQITAAHMASVAHVVILAQTFFFFTFWNRI